MAVRNGTAEWTDRLYRSANVPSYDAAYTVMVWFRITTAPGSYSYATLFSLRNEPAGTFYQDALNIFNYPGVGYLLDFYGRNNNTIVEFLGDTALSLNTWYCAAIVRASDTDRRIYIGDASNAFTLEGSGTSALGSRSGNPAAEANICESRSGVLEVGAVKVWTTALTLTQLQDEQYYDLAQYETSIRYVIPIVDTGASRGTDYSGNSYNFTTNGTMTDVTDPAAVEWDASSGTNVTVIAGAVIAQTIAPSSNVSAERNVTIAAGGVIAQAIAPAASVLAAQNVTIAAGGVLAQTIAPDASVLAVQNVSVAAGGVTATAVAPGAAVDAIQNATIETGAVIAFAVALAGVVDAIRNVTVAAGPVVATGMVGDASVSTTEVINATIEAGAVIAVGVAPAGVVDAIRDVTIAAGPVVATSVVGDASVSTTEVINATIEAGAVIAAAVCFEATVTTEISVAVLAEACIAIALAPDGDAFAERNITIAAGACMMIGLVGQAAVNQEAMIVTIDMTGELHTMVLLEGDLHMAAHVSGEIYTLAELEGEI